MLSSPPPPSPDRHQHLSLPSIDSFTPSIINCHSSDEFKKPVMINKKMTNTTDGIIHNQFTNISPPLPPPPPPLQQGSSSFIPLAIKNKSQYWPLKNQNEIGNNNRDNGKPPISSICSPSSIISLSRPILTSSSITSAPNNKMSNLKPLTNKSFISVQPPSPQTPSLINPTIDNNNNNNITYLLSKDIDEYSDSISFDSILLKYSHEIHEGDKNTKVIM